MAKCWLLIPCNGVQGSCYSSLLSAHIITYNHRLCQSISYNILWKKTEKHTETINTWENSRAQSATQNECTHTWERSRSLSDSQCMRYSIREILNLFAIWPIARQSISESGIFFFHSKYSNVCVFFLCTSLQIFLRPFPLIFICNLDQVFVMFVFILLFFFVHASFTLNLERIMNIFRIAEISEIKHTHKFKWLALHRIDSTD